MGIREPELPTMDAGLVPTQFVSGIRRPRFDGSVWIVEVYEERGGYAMVVARFAMTEATYQRSVALATAATDSGRMFADHPTLNG